jgi:hypothetical protein
MVLQVSGLFTHVQGDQAMPDAIPDRRASPRFSLILAATITDLETDAKFSARTSDVGRMGCYVDTLNPLPPDSVVGVCLTHGEENFETKGRVVHISPGLGMGIQFREPVPAEQLAILDRWLEEAARSPL